jgi:hypothetical protein
LRSAGATDEVLAFTGTGPRTDTYADETGQFAGEHLDVRGGPVADVDNDSGAGRVFGRELGRAVLCRSFVRAPRQGRARCAFDERDAVGLGAGVARDNLGDS